MSRVSDTGKGKEENINTWFLWLEAKINFITSKLKIVVDIMLVLIPTRVLAQGDLSACIALDEHRIINVNIQSSW